jgi:hypothetical protein
MPSSNVTARYAADNGPTGQRSRIESLLDEDGLEGVLFGIEERDEPSKCHVHGQKTGPRPLLV